MRQSLLDFLDNDFGEPTLQERFDFLPRPVKQTKGPVSLASSEWAHKEGKLIRKFSFKGSAQRTEFLRELMDLEDDFGHHADINATYNEVVIILTTHATGGITELDTEMASELSEIYDDIKARRSEE